MGNACSFSDTCDDKIFFETPRHLFYDEQQQSGHHPVLLHLQGNGQKVSITYPSHIKEEAGDKWALMAEHEIQGVPTAFPGQENYHVFAYNFYDRDNQQQTLSVRVDKDKVFLEDKFVVGNIRVEYLDGRTEVLALTFQEKCKLLDYKGQADDTTGSRRPPQQGASSADAAPTAEAPPQPADTEAA